MRDVDPRAVVEACHLAIDIAFGRLEVVDGMVDMSAPVMIDGMWMSRAVAKAYLAHPARRPS